MQSADKFCYLKKEFCYSTHFLLRVIIKPRIHGKHPKFRKLVSQLPTFLISERKCSLYLLGNIALNKKCRKGEYDFSTDRKTLHALFAHPDKSFVNLHNHYFTGNNERTFSNRRRRRPHGWSSPEPENNYETFWELQELNGDVKSRGISQDVIDQLPIYVLSSTDLMSRQDRSDCRVCMEKYKAGETERVLTCFHSFHVDCIDKWLLVSMR